MSVEQEMRELFNKLIELSKGKFSGKPDHDEAEYRAKYAEVLVSLYDLQNKKEEEQSSSEESQDLQKYKAFQQRLHNFVMAEDLSMTTLIMLFANEMAFATINTFDDEIFSDCLVSEQFIKTYKNFTTIYSSRQVPEFEEMVDDIQNAIGDF